MPDSRPPLATGALDRDAVTRSSEAAIAEAWRSADARVLVLRGALVPMASTGDALALRATSGAFSLRTDGATRSYLGRIDGAPVFAEEYGADAASGAAGEPTVSGSSAEADTGVAGSRWVHPFECAAMLSPAEREVLAVASALARWHESFGFSPRDGAPLELTLGGWAGVDPHGGEHFPRTDPAVIVLIEHEGRVLLGSNALWETNRFSLLAGFVEAGESAEHTVVREVFEEAGVRVDRVTYVASQPWPFPRSLMLGFRARLVPGSDPTLLDPDRAEISELRWFSRDELRDPAPELQLPGSLSIARWMIDAWIAEGDRADERA